MLPQQSWINIEQSKFARQLSSDTKKGVNFRVFVSPYDIPEAVRGYMDQGKKRFVIEFRYISDEPSFERIIDNKVTIHIGINSKRIYCIEIDVNALNANQVTVQIYSAIESVRNSYPTRKVRNSNLDITRDIVRNNWKSIRKAIPIN